jgi:hypothetical protein
MGQLKKANGPVVEGGWWVFGLGFLLSVYGEHAKTVSDRIFGESEPN